MAGQLLRQSGGCEGFRSLGELFPAHHLPVPEGVDVEHAALDLDPATSTACPIEDCLDHLVSRVDDFLGGHFNLIPCSLPTLPGGPNRISPVHRRFVGKAWK